MWIIFCSIGVSLSLTGEHRSNTALTAVGKMLAASAYLALAWSLGATGTVYGQVLLIGMGFCWLGDLLLISTGNRKLFLFGLVSFLLGHVAYIGAFAVRGVSLPAVAVTAVAMVVFAVVIMRWLRPSLDDRMRRPVLFYVIAISTMMAMAVGAWSADGNLAIPVGAFLFLVSDLAVARDRFVSPGFINRAWGLPLYFLAQIVLAYSVI